MRVSVMPSATCRRSAWASAFTVLLTPGDRAAHEIEVALVLELDLGDALGVDARRAHVALVGARPAEERPEHRLDEIRLAGAVVAVDADQARRERQVELVLVDAVVAQVEARQLHVSPSPPRPPAPGSRGPAR